MSVNYVEDGYVEDGYFQQEVYIDYATYEIHVPRTALTLVQENPTEIREMNLNWFRLQLKDLEDDPLGMAFPHTHNHNTEVSLGGLTFARVIEIVNGYTVTFEDGQYAVNLVGANSNVGDVVNVNQVSVRSQNSAGMTSSPDIEYASFQNAVTIDTVNGVAGTTFPTGTRRQPSNNLYDALIIARYRGLKKLFLESDLDITEGDLTGFLIEGNNHVSTIVKIRDAAVVNKLKIVQCTIQDTKLDHDVEIEKCLVRDIDYINGHIHDCGMQGRIVLGGNKDSVMANCYTIDQDTETVFDMGNTGNSLAAPNYSGVIRIQNLSDPEQEVGIGLNAGKAIIDPDVTDGLVIIGGDGLIENNSTGNTIVNTDGLSNAWLITRRTWAATAEYVSVNSITGTAGTEYPIGTKGSPVSNSTDARAIASDLGIQGYQVAETFALEAHYNDWRFEGYTVVEHDTVEIDGYDVQGCLFNRVTIQGTFGANSSGNEYTSCILNSPTAIVGSAFMCSLAGVLTMGAAGTQFNAGECHIVSSPLNIDMVGINRTCRMEYSNGNINVTNMGAGSVLKLTADHYSQLTIDSSCTGGSAILRGDIEVIDNSGGAVTITQYTNSIMDIAAAVWSGIEGSQVMDDIAFIKSVEGGKWEIVNNQMIFYAEDNTTELARFNLYDDSGDPNSINVYRRERL